MNKKVAPLKCRGSSKSFVSKLSPLQQQKDKFTFKVQLDLAQQIAKMENGVKINGNDHESRPRTPSMNAFSLTEYSTNPSPPRSTPKPKMSSVVPPEFLLPNGTPDVCYP